MARFARMFLAVWPPGEVVERLRALPRPALPGLRWARPEQWHVTVQFLGQVDEVTALDALQSRPDGVCEAVAGPATERFGRRVLHLPVAGLDSLAVEQPYHGHLTLARVRRSGRAVDLRPLCGWPFAARWPVAELTLVESRPGPEGSQYTIVERRSLRPS